MGKKDPISYENFSRELANFSKQQDRGMVLICAAWIEDALEECVREQMQPGEPTDRIMSGPLRNFSTRIQLASALGLIDDGARKDLVAIHDMRNDFAHIREHLTMEDPRAKQRFESTNFMSTYRGIGGIAELDESASSMLTLFTFAVVGYLGNRTKKKLRPVAEDSYAKSLNSTFGFLKAWVGFKLDIKKAREERKKREQSGLPPGAERGP